MEIKAIEQKNVLEEMGIVQLRENAFFVEARLINFEIVQTLLALIFIQALHMVDLNLEIIRRAIKKIKTQIIVEKEENIEKKVKNILKIEKIQ